MDELVALLNQPENATRLILVSLVGVVLLGGGLLADILILVRLLGRPLRWTQRAGRLLGRPWRGVHLWSIVGLITVVNISMIAVAKFQSHDGDLSRGDIFGMIVVQTILFQGGGVLLVWAMMKGRALSWRRSFGVTTRKALRELGLGVVFYFAAIPPLLLGTLLYRALLVRLNVPLDPQDIIQLFLRPDTPAVMQVYLVLMAAVIAPVAEEILFRGVGLPVLSRRLGLMPGLVVVSLLFALIHFHIPSMVPLFIIAMAFGLAYLASGSLLTSIAMHATFNSVSLIVLILVGDMPGLAVILQEPMRWMFPLL